MAPAVISSISDNKSLQRQLGCMASFLHLFDRHHRIYAPKHLIGSRSGSESESSSSSTRSEYSSPEPPPLHPPLPLDTWKLKEAPRLSLDSRLRPRDQRTHQIPPSRSQDKIQRPTSVVAKLMGLDNLPPPPPPELRRSASESRVSYRFVDDILLHKPPPPPPNPSPATTTTTTRSKSKPPPPHDFFPDPTRSLIGSGPAKDIETLKLILEASQLKGLLHNPPIVLLKPDPKPVKKKIRNPPTVRSPRKIQSKSTAKSPPLLKRCDELLRSIAALEEQPSPVSVLDKDFLCDDDSYSSSPVAIPAVGFYVPESDRDEFGYVYDILWLSERHDSLADVYNVVRKRYGERKVVFDAVAEIVVRKRQVSGWEALRGRCVVFGAEQMIREVWLEVRRSAEVAAGGEDLNDVTCGAIRKDLVGGGGDHGWADTSAEMCDAVVLQIERLLFKDAVDDVIRDLADVARGKKLIPRRRKLVF